MTGAAPASARGAWNRAAARLDPILLPRIAIWALAMWTLSFTVADPDLWGHVRFGQDILAARSVPATDPYSFTSDRPWVNHEWLAEVFMAAAFDAAGAPGLVVLKLLVLGAGFWAMTRELRRRGVDPLPRDVLLVVGILGCLSLTKTMRPQVFSVLLFASVVACLRAAEDGRRAALLVAAAAMAVWANLHGGWLVGLGTAGVWVGLRVLAPAGVSRAVWIAGGTTMVFATLLTPEGPRLWQFLYDTVGLGRADISEWQPIYRLPLSTALPWLLITPVAVAALWRMRGNALVHSAVILLLLVVSFRVMRVVSFFAIATVMLGGARLAPGRLRARVAKPAARPALAVVLVMAVVWLGASLVLSSRNVACIPLTGEWAVDLEAAEAIRTARLQGRMLTWFDWGEYAIWHFSPGLRVSMDGRRETVYSDAVQQLHNAIYYAQPGWEVAVEQIAADYIWLPNRLAIGVHLESKGWVPIFASEDSTVFGRSGSRALNVPRQAFPSCFPG